MRNFIRPIARFFFSVLALGRKRGPHVTRYTMYKELARFKLTSGGDVSALSISHSQDLCKILGATEAKITNTNYPDVSILSLPYADESFDLFVADQVLEHVGGDPKQAMRESFRVVRPGGLVVHTTCCIMPMHMQPYDYWRFTPHGLRLLAEEHGEVLEADGWGHPAIVLLDALGLRHEPIPVAPWHPAYWIATSKRQSWPVSTWLVARKPLLPAAEAAQ